MLVRSYRWQDLPLLAKGMIVTAIPMIPLLLVTTLFTLAHRRERSAQDDVTQTLRIRADLQEVLARLIDAETAIRGYLLVHDRAFLQVYERATQRLPVLFTRLTASARDEEQKRNLRALQEVVDRELREFAHLRDPLPGQASMPAHDMRRTTATMDDIRHLAAEIMQRGDQLFDERQARADAAAGRTLLLVYTGTFLGLSGGLAAVLLFSRGVTDRIERVRRNAELLGSSSPLLPGPGGRDEVGQLGERIESAARMLAERDEALATRVAEVTAAHKELEAFSYSVSHDLRAPLRHIVGFAALLTNHAGAGLDTTSGRYLRTITGAAQQMGRLVDDLLSFSRMGRQEMLHNHVDLAEMVRDIVGHLNRDASHRRVVWKIDDLPPVRGDSAMLRVAVANLLENAFKYTSQRDPAEIEIGTMPSPTGGRILFIRDNGAGFDMTYASKLFQVFQRLHMPEDFEGTGIGLANVRRIVERHGGRVWAEGRVNEGATFFVEFPPPDGRSVATC